MYNNKLNINESFICRIWESADEYLTSLKTTEGAEVEIIDYGKKNYDSGPDYLDASIKIGGKLLKGHVEVHQDFKHWFDHEHPADRKYVPVILHVVLWDSANRKSPKLRIKRELPTVILANHLKYSIHHIWQEIINKPSSRTKLPCFALNDDIGDEVINKWFSALAFERLKMKSARIKERLLELEKENTGGEPAANYLKQKANWEQAFYEFLFESLGFSKNKDQMMKLARILKLKTIKPLLKNISSKEKLLISALFGISGLLFDVRAKDDYINDVKDLWIKLEKKIKAERLSKADWHFFRLRPQNFPTRRIACGSQFILKILNNDLFRQIVVLFQDNEIEPKEIYKHLSQLLKPGRDDYWMNHYNFGKISSAPAQLLGAQRIDDMVVNVITPFLYLYADVFARRSLKNRVIDFYTKLKTKPDNSIVKLIQSQVIKKRKISINTPASEQAVIQLYNFYCARDRCKDCSIGKFVFKDTGFEYKIIFY